MTTPVTGNEALSELSSASAHPLPSASPSPTASPAAPPSASASRASSSRTGPGRAATAWRNACFQSAGILSGAGAGTGGVRIHGVKQRGWDGLPEYSILVDTRWSTQASRDAQPDFLAGLLAQGRHGDALGGHIRRIEPVPSEYIYRRITDSHGDGADSILAVKGLDGGQLDTALSLAGTIQHDMQGWENALRSGRQSEDQIRTTMFAALHSALQQLGQGDRMSIEPHPTTKSSALTRLDIADWPTLKPDYAVGLTIEELALDLPGSLPVISWLTSCASRLSTGPSGDDYAPAFPYAVFELKKPGSLDYAQHQVLTVLLPALKARLYNKELLREASAVVAARADDWQIAGQALDVLRQGSASGSTPMAPPNMVSPRVTDIDRLLGADTEELMYSVIASGSAWDVSVTGPVDAGRNAHLVEALVRTHKINTYVGCVGFAIDLVGIVLQGIRYRSQLQAVLNIVAQHPALQRHLCYTDADDASGDGNGSSSSRSQRDVPTRKRARGPGDNVAAVNSRQTGPTGTGIPPADRATQERNRLAGSSHTLALTRDKLDTGTLVRKWLYDVCAKPVH